MSVISLSQNELVEKFGENEVLSSVITFYERELMTSGEVICRVSVNDMILSEADEQKLSHLSIGEIRKIKIDAENTAILQMSVVQDWIRNLPELIKMVDQISQQIRIKGFASSLTPFTQIIDACQLLVSSLSSIRSVEMQKNIFPTEKWTHSEIKLKKAFDEVMEACQNNQETELADILEYDLANSLTEWLEILKENYAS